MFLSALGFRMGKCLSNIPLPWSSSFFLLISPEGFAVHIGPKPLLSSAWTLPGQSWWWLWAGTVQDTSIAAAGNSDENGAGPQGQKASGGPASQRLRCSQMLMALRSSAALLVWVRKIFWEGIGPVITGNLISIQKDQPRQLVDNDYFFSSLKEGCVWTNIWEIVS